MAKIIPFRRKQKNEANQIDAQAKEMLDVAADIDYTILKYVGKSMDPRDMAGLLAHRLGTLMRHVQQEQRQTLWLIVQKVLREQADLPPEQNVSDL